MRLALTEEQEALRDVTRALLADRCGPDVLRTPLGDERRTALLAGLGELGVWGLLVPEEHGGLGFDENTLVPFLEEAGRAAVPLPLVESVAVAPVVLEPLGLAGKLAAGELRCVCDPDGVGPVAFVAESRLLLRGGRGGRGAIRVLDISASPRAPLPAVDPVVELSEVDGGEELGVVDDPALVALAWHRGVLGTAAQLIGLGRCMLDLTVGYVGERRQFGVPVGSFQAIKHHLASALVALEFAAATVSRAGALLAAGAPEAALHVASAKALASDAARQVAGTSIQCHGAIGYTTEYDLHIYAKRAWALAASWGSAAWHRDRVATLLGLSRTGNPPLH